MAIIYKIHPAIGVARLGDAPDEFYVGPDSEDEIIDPPGGFKDANCRLKRQAARFYIYSHDTVTGATQEVTGQIDELEWNFIPRNGKYRSATVEEFVPSLVRVRNRLARETFSLKIGWGGPSTLVHCGELRTDQLGRLIFLGGLGKAGVIPGHGSPMLEGLSDYFWDDTSEGEIVARFTRDGTDWNISAWALAAPPRDIPNAAPRTSYYDYLVGLATTAGRAASIQPPTPGTPYAIDKAHLHYVYGSRDLGDGLEARVTLDLQYPTLFEVLDPLRPRAGTTASILLSNVANPWHGDICTWGTWRRDGFASIADFAMNWSRKGLRVTRDGVDVVVEECRTDLNITLLTPNIDFREVPRAAGGLNRTVMRAIEFDVVSTSPISLEYVTPPTGAFARGALDPGPIGPTGTGIRRVRFWVSYTTTTNAEDRQTVVLQHAASGSVWSIPLHAIPTARRYTATALVLDRSGSMQLPAGGTTTKSELLATAAKRFLDAALNNDYIQLVRYNHTAEAVPLGSVAVTELTDASRTALKSHFDGSEFAPDGSTSIGAGIRLGRSLLATAPTISTTGATVHRAMVILTDGLENRAPYIADEAGSIDATTYAIGLGTPANTSAAALQAVAGNHGGYMLVTGGITSEHEYLLDKYFLQILAAINRADVVFDPQGELEPGHTHTLPFHITDADAGFEAYLLTTLPRAVNFTLVSPGGKTLAPERAAADPTLEFIRSEALAYYRVPLPIESTGQLLEKEGTWHAKLSLDAATLSPEKIEGLLAQLTQDQTHLVDERKRLLSHQAFRTPRLPSKSLSYAFVVHAYSSISLRVSLRQSSFEPGGAVTLQASLLNCGVLPVAGAQLKAEVTPPEGPGFDIELAEVGCETGRYNASFTADLAGVYRCRIMARGKTIKGHVFTREQTLTVSVWHGGDRDAATPPKSPTGHDEQRRLICEALDCLLGHQGVLRPELVEKLEKHDVDIKRLRQCLARLCRDRPEHLEHLPGRMGLIDSDSD